MMRFFNTNRIEKYFKKKKTEEITEENSLYRINCNNNRLFFQIRYPTAHAILALNIKKKKKKWPAFKSLATQSNMKNTQSR